MLQRCCKCWTELSFLFHSWLLSGPFLSRTSGLSDLSWLNRPHSKIYHQESKTKKVGNSTFGSVTLIWGKTTDLFFLLLGILTKCIFLSLLELVLPRWTSRCFGGHFLCLSGNGAPSSSHLLPLACPSVATDEVVSDWKLPSSAASNFGQDRLLSGFSNRQHETIHLCGRSPAYRKKWIRKWRWVKRNTTHLFL